jgi:hypothetical protein
MSCPDVAITSQPLKILYVLSDRGLMKESTGVVPFNLLTQQQRAP